jgi:1,2-beta-oligoglucan phosphorylase
MIMKITNQPGLTIEFLENGSIRCIDASPSQISMKPASLFSKSGANIFLRKRVNPVEYSTILGPESNSRFEIRNNVFFANGSFLGVDYSCSLQLSPNSLSWQWTVILANTTSEPVELDLLCTQDAGLKAITDGLVNEYYVSQYLERRILEDQNLGTVICCRQNIGEHSGNPWLMMACSNSAVSASVDGMQFFGNSYRITGIPEASLADKLGGEYSGESSFLALQEKPFTLAPGECHTTRFIGTFMTDHPGATSLSDLDLLPGIFSEFPENPAYEVIMPVAIVTNLFNTASFLPAEELNQNDIDRFFGQDKRHCESENNHLVSFFREDGSHVVLKAKEALVDRPHAHILQAYGGFSPDENIMSTTSFACGIFNSHISQGNTNFNVFLSICTSQLNLEPQSGQRIFIELKGKKYLLGVPSAFEMGLNFCRWIYKHEGSFFQVRTWTSKKEPRINLDFRVISGEKVNLLITHAFDPLNGWSVFPGSSSEFIVRPGAGSMISGKFPKAQFRIIVNMDDCRFRECSDEVLFSDYKSHDSSLFILDVDEINSFCMSFIGEVCKPFSCAKITDIEQQWLTDLEDAHSAWEDLSLGIELYGEDENISAIREILPWYGMNALTHFLTPYGLEQFSGAAWGTRDISQGPFDLLLGMEKYDAAKKVLLTIFSNQNPDGGWPQWWMFDSYSNIRAGDSHGDVFYWCIIALSNYIKVTGDKGILDEKLPYYHEQEPSFAEKTPLSEHMERLIRMITGSFIPGTSLVPFGGGDWNDSLQPVSKELADRMISSWTVEMNYQAFMHYRQICEMTGNMELATELNRICEQIRLDFNKHLIRNGVVAGYGIVEKDNSITLLLHPADSSTGIRYSILPMNRGIISGIFTKEQAIYHQVLIEQHLKGPDGARLMDRPLKYKGGVMEIFQRAETSTFFGREIGLMYLHEHIRYAEALAIMGKADAFIKALRQAIPVGYRDVVPCGDFRQSNCYYSSSDVAFRNRYEADDLYDDITKGKLLLKGGWRVYSSGPGIYIGLVMTRLLGLRIDSKSVIIDPVIPHALHELAASLKLLGRKFTFIYLIENNTYSPSKITINGKTVGFTIEKNNYRRGGAVIDKHDFILFSDQEENIVEVHI